MPEIRDQAPIAYDVIWPTPKSSPDPLTARLGFLGMT